MNVLTRLQHRRALPLALRLAATLLLVTAASMLVLAVVMLYGVRSYEAQRRTAELEAQVDFYQSYATELAAAHGGLMQATPVLVARSVEKGDIAIRVFGTAGQLFGASGSAALFPSRQAAQYLSSSIPMLLVSEDPQRRYQARPVELNGLRLGVIEVSQSTAEEQRLFVLLRRVVAQSVGIALLAALIGAIIVARWLARLIGRLRQVAERIAQGDLAVRAPHGGPDEIAQLTHALNTMADQLAERLARIEASAEAQRRFYRDVSHELRTPLMALGGYLENLEDAVNEQERTQSIAALRGEVQRLARLADELLRSDQAPTIDLDASQSVDLRALIDELVLNLRGRARRGGVSLHTELATAPLMVQGDRDRLKQALINVIDNALRATPPGGSITVRAVHQADAIELHIVDTGSGIAPALRDAVWERGVRGADGGSGLGLAIVRSIMQAHGGSATLLPSDHGVHIVLRLPAQPVAAPHGVRS